MRDLVIALAALNVFVSPVVAVGLALRTIAEGWGPSALGVLVGSIGAAAVVGTLVMLRWRPDREVVDSVTHPWMRTENASTPSAHMCL